jgi:hypothetical protein
MSNLEIKLNEVITQYNELARITKLLVEQNKILKDRLELIENVDDKMHNIILTMFDAVAKKVGYTEEEIINLYVKLIKENDLQWKFEDQGKQDSSP